MRGANGVLWDRQRVTRLKFTIPRAILTVLGRQVNNDKKAPCDRPVDKGTLGKSRGRKATAPRLLRDAACDATKDPKIAGLPQAECLRSRHA